MNERGGLRQAALALAVVSVLTTLGAGITAGVAAGQGDDPDGSGTLVRGKGDPTESGTGPSETSTTEDPGFDYTGWKVVNGMPGDSGEVASYRLPPTSWKPFASDYAVSFTDKSGKAYVSGHALANYYGNRCKDGGERVPGGWTVLADTVPSGDLKTIAEDAARGWARGYGTNANGTTGTMTRPVAKEVTLDDGTTAARASIDIDMSIFSGVCLPTKAQVSVTTIDTSEGAKTLVQARYVSAVGITDTQWRAIGQSLED
ncbi:hypothetical protein [Nocardioides sp. Root140]|uniref:hypothetical protein n=1 Tax=Nocardioides sp. Root140 TaxID=1736460 RepID=UPI0006FBB076|nr:hypothetical protein [Nocardioides sp. Root140]KQY56587.1 hypothetical protein ASD30_09675 [Nocardioides sp. Root140]